MSDHILYKDIKLGAIDEDIIDFAYIEQTLKVVNAIPIGSLPFEPLKGSTVPMSVDNPINGEFVATVVSGTYNALNDLFPDVTIKKVTINRDSDTIDIVPVIDYTGDLRP